MQASCRHPATVGWLIDRLHRASCVEDRGVRPGRMKVCTRVVSDELCSCWEAEGGLIWALVEIWGVRVSQWRCEASLEG